jgi:prepilin-type processing-associated H-X9-DG protein
MGGLIIGAIILKARNCRRAVALIGIGLICVGGAVLPAAADNGPLYVAPGPSNLLAPDVVRRSQEQLAGTARKLGDLIGDALRSPTSHAVELVVTTKCGHYLSANISFADGSAKTLNLGNAPATQSDMDKAKAAIPILRIVDQPGCEQR